MTTNSGTRDRATRHHFRARDVPNLSFLYFRLNLVPFGGHLWQNWPILAYFSNYLGFANLATLARLILVYKPIITKFSHILIYLDMPDVLRLARRVRYWAWRAGILASRV